jgi:hypothetical protein
MDRYTQIVLTIIAIALSVQVLQRAASPAHAADVLKVAICDPYNSFQCAQVGSGKLSIAD